MNLYEGEVAERSGDGSIAMDKSAVKVRKTQETLKSLAVVGSRPLLYRLDLLRVFTDVPSQDDVFPEGGRGAGEFTFLSLNEEPILQKPTEDLAYTRGVFFRGLREDEDVVEIN